MDIKNRVFVFQPGIAGRISANNQNMPGNGDNGKLHLTMKVLVGILFVIAVVLAALPGCSDSDISTVRLAHNNWPGYEPLSLARELDLYHGVDVVIQRADSATDVIKAFEQGFVDLAAVTLDEALRLKDGNPSSLLIIAVLDVSHGGDVIIASPGIRSVNELKGRRVGVEANALGAFMISRAMDFSNGLSVEDLQVVPLTHERHLDAFLNGEVEAVVTFEPVKSQLLRNNAHVVFDSTSIPGEIVDVLIVKQQMANQNPEAVSRVVAGYFRALKHVEQNPQSADRIMGGYEGLTAAEFQQSKKGIQIPDLEQNRKLIGGRAPELTKTIERLQQVMLVNRIIQKPVITTELFVDSFLPRKE
jgi:NitT/TauT family transport system substrate-binding protein